MQQPSSEGSGRSRTAGQLPPVFVVASRQGGYLLVRAVFAGMLTVLAPLSAAVANDCSPAAEAMAMGQAVATASCKRCHGMEGHGNPDTLQSTQAKVPHLAAQPRNYLAKAIAGYVMGFNWQEDPKSVFFTAGMRVDDTMGMIASSLKKDEVEAVSLWYHCQN